MRRILFATVAASAIVLAPFIASAQSTTPMPDPGVEAVPADGAPPGAPPAMPPPADTPATPGPAAPEAAAAPAAPVAPPASPVAEPSAAAAPPAQTALACQAQNTTVFFLPGSTTLDERAQTAVTQPVTNASGCTLSSVEVAGYSDTAGSEAANLVVSERRAEAVRDALVASGVSAEIVRVEGRGEADASGDANRDRRAEVRLVFALAEPAAPAASAVPLAPDAAAPPVEPHAANEAPATTASAAPAPATTSVN
ncbi:MAG: OmpA family protein [Terricaulis sp.]